MLFEFNPPKSQLNKAKHGIDFIAAQDLWDDPFLVIVPAKTTEEARFLAIGKIGVKSWTAVYTLRENKIRLISVRRSRQEERDFYESA